MPRAGSGSNALLIHLLILAVVGSAFPLNFLFFYGRPM